MRNQICIRNLERNVTSAGLGHLCAPYGTVVSTRLVRDGVTGLSRGVGYVEMGSGESALAAIVGLDGRVVEGLVLFVR